MSALQTEALTAKDNALNGADTGTIKSVIHNIFSVKPESLLVKLDENGEPVL